MSRRVRRAGGGSKGAEAPTGSLKKNLRQEKGESPPKHPPCGGWQITADWDTDMKMQGFGKAPDERVLRCRDAPGYTVWAGTRLL